MKKPKLTVVLPISPEITTAFNNMDVTMSCLDALTRISTWTALEEFAIRKKVVKRVELRKAPGATVNGPGLRFRGWLVDLIHASELSAKKLEARKKRAVEIIATLKAVLDLAREKFASTIEEAK